MMVVARVPRQMDIYRLVIGMVSVSRPTRMEIAELSIMDSVTPCIPRDGNWRFPRPIRHPRRKQPGTRNRANHSGRSPALRRGGENIAPRMRAMRVGLDRRTARFCLCLLVPKPRGGAVRLQLARECRRRRRGRRDVPRGAARAGRGRITRTRRCRCVAVSRRALGVCCGRGR